jgi:hypothetical protein
MNIHVDVEVQGDLLLAMASGTLSFDAALGVWKQWRSATKIPSLSCGPPMLT